MNYEPCCYQDWAQIFTLVLTFLHKIHPYLLSPTKLLLVTQEKAIASRKRMATWSPLATLIVNTHSYFLPQYTRQPCAGSTILCRWVQNVLYHLPEYKILLHFVPPPQMGWPPPGQASCSSSQVGASSPLLIFQLFSSCDLPMYYVSQSCPKVVSKLFRSYISKLHQSCLKVGSK